VTSVVEGRKQDAGENEARKRTWRRGPQDRPLRSKAWTLREFGGKTVWDWLQLLIVPLALVLVTLAFTWQQDNRQQEIQQQSAERERKLEDQRARAAQELEEQRGQDVLLQAYLDQMSQLLLEKDLRNAEEGSEARTLARARTLAVMQRLDADRNQTIARFLTESKLIETDETTIGLLKGAGLEEANLERVDLTRADLSGADLSDADLSDADLLDADLRDAILRGATLRNANFAYADLTGANLSGADLSGAVLDRANLSGAFLYRVGLSGAFLYGASLSGADLSDANLSDADLIEIDLSGADLSGADLSGARGVTDEELEGQATVLQGATMPDGSIHD
jgi:uncharacterized protein YjbI with pentapeptide repeats